MEKEILKLLGEKDGEFFEGDVSGDTIILYSRIEKLFLKLQETIQKNVYELSDTTKKLIQNDAKIATNLYVIAAELIRWYSTKISDVANEKVVDTAGAGDWTAAALINYLFKDKVMFGICNLLESDLEIALKKAQKVGAESCSYEGARGMMQQ